MLGMISRSGAAFLIVLSVMTARGCSTDISDGPVAIQRQGDSLLIAVCRPVESDDVSMQERDEGSSWQDFWTIDVKVSLQAGDVISPTDGAALGVANGEQPEMKAGDNIFVLFRGLPGSPEPHDLSGTFSIGKDGLSETQWLHPDETVSDTPCP